MGVNILPISPGKWRLRTETGKDADGKRLFTYETVAGTKEDAELRKSAIILALRQQRSTAPTATFGPQQRLVDYWQDWLDERDNPNAALAPSSVYQYRWAWRRAAPLLGDVTVAGFGKAQARQFLKDLCKIPTLGPRSVRAVLRAVSTCLTTAEAADAIPFNPIGTLKYKAPPSDIARSATRTERRAIVEDASQGTQIGLVTRLMIATGLRRGEAAGLDWRDVDLEEGKIRVRQGYVQVGSKLYLRPPKTKSGKRTIGIPPSLVAELRICYAEASEWCKEAGVSVADRPVFVNARGRRWAPGQLSKHVSTRIRAASGSKLRTHDMRHTHATELLQSVPLGTVSRRMGHSSKTITLQIYEHAIPGEDDRATDAASKLFD